MNLRPVALLVFASLPASAQDFRGVDYDDGVRLSQAQVDACRARVAPLNVAEEDLRFACGEEGDNVGRGTISVRITAGEGFVGCVRGLQRLYREHAPRRTRVQGAGAHPPYAFLVNCAYVNTAGRRMIAQNGGRFEACAAPSVARGTRPTGISTTIRRCVTPRRYRIDAAFDGMPAADATTGEAAAPSAEDAGSAGD